MRIDHLAFRVFDRLKTADFFVKALRYRVAEKYPNGFHIKFEDNTFADCTVLEPGSKTNCFTPWILTPNRFPVMSPDIDAEYHLPPEIFISQGSHGSIVDSWVKKNGNGLHHIALLVDSVEDTKRLWEDNGFAEFASDEIERCPGLTQIFTKPSDLTGFVWELIEREVGEDGFCQQNVKNLMLSTKERLIE